MKSRMLVFAVLASLLLLITGQRALWAQSGAGSIQGTVTDATGAAIRGAAVHVVNVATGVATDTKTNGVGFYQAPELFTGRYTLTASAPGMKTYQTSIELLVAQDAVISPVLLTGETTQTVVVSGSNVQLTTVDNGAITTTLENERINQLPENGRDLTNLVLLTTPGMVNNEAGGANIYGLRAEALDFLVDNVSTQNGMKGGEFDGARALVDPDSVQEVRMVANGAGAQYATPAAAVATTKSGTNRLHGTLFETAVNSVFGVAKSRQDPSGFSAPHYVRNEFGASAGGPIVLPNIYDGKDRSFWFFAYERQSIADEKANLANVPTVAMSQGNFNGLTSAKGIAVTLYDPATTSNQASCAANGGKANKYCRTPFAFNGVPNQINPLEESPLAKLYYALSPLPTNSATNPLATSSSNLTQLDPELFLESQITTRLDHVFDANNRAYLRYTQNISTTDITGGPRNRAAGGIPVGAAVGSGGYLSSPIQTYLTAVGYTHIFSPTFFAETVVSQQWLSDKSIPGADPNVDYESMLGLPNNFGELGFPAVGNGNLIFSLGSSQTDTAQVSQIVSIIDENLTKTAGRHQMQFGARFRHQRTGALPDLLADHEGVSPNTTAIYQPTSLANYTAVSNTGNDDASFFLGSANNYTVNLEAPYLHMHTLEFDAYFQDNYHVSRNITLNLGLRYEAHPALWTKYGLVDGFDLKNDAQVLAVSPATLIAEGYTTQAIITNLQNIGVKFETPEEAGLPANTLVKSFYLNFLPRVGIAYQPFGGRHGTVIRGAYGRYIDSAPQNDYFLNRVRNTPYANTFTQSYATANQAVDQLPNELLRYNDPVMFPVMGVNSSNAVNTNASGQEPAGILPGISAVTASPDLAPPLVSEANVTIEQAVKGNSALRVSWVWTHSTNLVIPDAYNNQPSTYQWEMATGTVPPTGNVVGSNQYSTTATGPYDQTTWGAGNKIASPAGWSNYNALEIAYQRLYHHGYAYQIAYDFSKAMRAGGNTGPNDSGYAVDPYANFPGALGTVSTMTPAYGAVYPGVAPPAPPAGSPNWADYHAMDKFQDYQLDTNEPIQLLRFNGIVDLPVGRGKRFLGNVNRFWNEVVGGFQIAGTGKIQSQVFQLAAANWGPANPIHIYKHSHPIVDCRSGGGVCNKSFLWFNGYLAPTVTTGVAGSTCTANCVSGLPADYVPEQAPIDNVPGDVNYGDNVVQVSAPTLSGGQPVTATYDAGPSGSNYLQKSYFNGPMNYMVDMSIFKVFPITEGMNLRVNVDFFNALNVQGWNNPNTTTGVEDALTSHNSPRQIQLTARLTF